jgi:hypothetical protein
MGGWTPTDVAQQSLDEAGIDFLLGDIEDGSRPAQVILRAYRQTLMQLLRVANWDAARKEADLNLLADSTGQTANVGTLVPGNQFQYEYAYPIDAVKVRYIPRQGPVNPGAVSGNITPPNPNVPLMPNLNQAPSLVHRMRPAKFVVTSDPNYPPPAGSILSEVQGVSPTGRTVILCNVKSAKCVYTFLNLYPSTWDALFREAFVALLASRIVLPLSKDKKAGLEMRKAQMEIARDAIVTARAIDGNEGTYSSNIPVNWIDTRYMGAGWYWGRGAGFGGAGADMWGGWDDDSVEGGSAY